MPQDDPSEPPDRGGSIVGLVYGKTPSAVPWMSMGLLSDRERDLGEALSALTTCNPFGEERIALERRALGEAFLASGLVWHRRAEGSPHNPNEAPLAAEAERLAAVLRGRLVASRARSATRASQRELDIYRDLVLYVLYYRYQAEIYEALHGPASAPRRPLAFYGRFVSDLDSFLALPGHTIPPPQPAPHLFAYFVQVRRAFHLVINAFVGRSAPAARLRAQVWESIFTRDTRRYRRALWSRMGDITTLVVGPSGTGKELVARAVALARYLPFDAERCTCEEITDTAFQPLNLAALSPTLIESELFGHRRGAFTGAVAERAGWLEVCPHLGTVFLDEIAETEPAIQVKLLRVLETRVFSRLGESRPRSFRGKLIAATNRDLAVEIREGRFREDLYYRLCADTVTTPTLFERLADTPEELPLLVGFLAQRLVGEDEGPAVAAEVVAWIQAHLGDDYPWPGNVRELMQCTSNVLVRGRYEPAGRAVAGGAGAGTAAGPRERLAAELAVGNLSAEEALNRYCSLVYADTGSYVEAAERLGLDRRTVRGRVDRELARSLRAAARR